MNTLGQDIAPGTIVRVAPSVVKPQYAADTTFVCRGGGGLYAQDNFPPDDNGGEDWHVYGTWQLDGEHGIIASDMIVEVVSVPTTPLPVLTFLETIDWIQSKEYNGNQVV